jgi:hypothetical protein
MSGFCSPLMASVKYVGVGSYATDPHVREMVLARLAQSACYGHDLPVS